MISINPGTIMAGTPAFDTAPTEVKMMSETVPIKQATPPEIMKRRARMRGVVKGPTIMKRC